ncbi:hypothetical protein ACJRO7_008134 [Eucalyptus globulus]|uniref:Nodulin-like domain-containing protein n=1 Tax=Eucalyptus globulus TaxID=34317 RepID=A0ABD3IQB3_EUCGL
MDRGYPKSFLWQVLTGPWFMLSSTLLIMFVNERIKSYFGYDQTTLNLLGFYKDLGGNLGVVFGFIYELAPLRAQMCLYTCVGANSLLSQHWGPGHMRQELLENRGCVIGLLKGFIGLSGAIITQIYHASYGDDPAEVILLIAWLPAVVSLVFIRVIRIMKASQPVNEVAVFYPLLYIALGLAGFLMIVIIPRSRIKFTRSECSGSAFVVLMMLILPFGFVINEETKVWKAEIKCSPNDLPFEVVLVDQAPGRTSPAEARSTAPRKLDPLSCLGDILRPPKRGEDHSILQAIFNIDMLILIVSTTCGVGGIVAVINNLGQIGSSLGYPPHTSRPLMVPAILLFTCVSHTLLASAVLNSLYITAMIMGFCLGVQLPLVITLRCTTLGRYRAQSVLYIFNVKVAGHLYDKQAQSQLRASGLMRRAGDPLSCAGVKCYQTAFMIITAATFLGCLVSEDEEFLHRRYVCEVQRRPRKRSSRCRCDSNKKLN